MEAPKLKELVELVKHTMIGESYNQTGMCCIINKLYEQNLITYSEKKIIKEFLDKNKPTPENEYKEFRQSKYWIDEGYWWYEIYVFNDTKQIRIDYLTKLISNIK